MTPAEKEKQEEKRQAIQEAKKQNQDRQKQTEQGKIIRK
jgi:hypothetical protein